jgi:hypothetical protein
MALGSRGRASWSEGGRRGGGGHAIFKWGHAFLGRRARASEWKRWTGLVSFSRRRGHSGGGSQNAERARYHHITRVHSARGADYVPADPTGHNYGDSWGPDHRSDRPICRATQHSAADADAGQTGRVACARRSTNRSRLHTPPRLSVHRTAVVRLTYNVQCASLTV